MAIQTNPLSVNPNESKKTLIKYYNIRQNPLVHFSTQQQPVNNDYKTAKVI